MRDRIWKCLVNIKFKALYTCECSKKADMYGRLYSFIIALASATSIATWAVWKAVPSLWATIIAVSQVLHVAKQYFPFIKNDKSFLEMSYDFEALYLDLERLWYSLENGSINQKEAEQLFYEHRKRELEIEKTHKGVHCPEFKKWVNTITQATHKSLEINFSTENDNA